MYRLPNVKNVNKGKRHKKKHQFKVGTPIVFKWYGERDCGFISALTFEKVTKNAQYSIKSTGRIGCIYHTMELDDPDDPYCYISSVLTKSITANEKKKVSDHREGKYLITNPPPIPPKSVIIKKKASPIVVKKKVVKKKVVKKKVVKKKVVKPNPTSINKTELKAAIKKQKEFINGEIDKNFW